MKINDDRSELLELRLMSYDCVRTETDEKGPQLRSVVPPPPC